MDHSELGRLTPPLCTVSRDVDPVLEHVKIMTDHP